MSSTETAAAADVHSRSPFYVLETAGALWRGMRNKHDVCTTSKPTYAYAYPLVVKLITLIGYSNTIRINSTRNPFTFNVRIAYPYCEINYWNCGIDISSHGVNQKPLLIHQNQSLHRVCNLSLVSCGNKENASMSKACRVRINSRSVSLEVWLLYNYPNQCK